MIANPNVKINLKYNIMKRLLLLFVFSMTCLLSVGQTKEEAIYLMKIASEEASKNMPQSMGVLTIDKMEVVGNDYITYVTIDEMQLDFDEYVANMQSNKSMVASMILGYNEQFAEVFKASGLNIIYVIKGNISRREAKVFYSAYELNNAPDKAVAFNDFINHTIAQVRKDLPQDWGNGLTLTDVYFEDNNFCYKVKTDESIMTLGLLKSIKAEGTTMEESMLEELAADPASKVLIEYLTQGNVGIKYVFWAEGSYEYVTFTITNEMLRRAVSPSDFDMDYEEFDYIEEVEEEAVPFQLVEEKPSFQGGDTNNFSKWVNERLVYPEIAKKNRVQGRVTVQFTVEKDGSVTKVKVIRGVDPALDKEAVRVVSMSPKWTPGKQGDRVVSVTYNFPVIFQLR